MRHFSRFKKKNSYLSKLYNSPHLEKAAAILAIISAIGGIVIFLVGGAISNQKFLGLTLENLENVGLFNHIYTYRYKYGLSLFLIMVISFLVAYSARVAGLKDIIERWELILNLISVAEKDHMELENICSDYLDRQDYNSMENAIKRGLETSCSQLAEIFEVYTSNESHVCLKEFDGQQVYLVARDKPPVQYVRYEGKPSSYPVVENTALHAVGILNKEYFVSNNLGTEEKYDNSNNDWKKFYNATAVIGYPINRVQQNTVGFLCVDNLEGGFDEESTIVILTTFARFHHHIIDLYKTKSGKSIRI